MLPTRAEIAELEQELGFPFRTAHFTVPVADTEPGDTAFYRHDVMPSDLVRQTVSFTQRCLEQLWNPTDEEYTRLNHQAEDRYNEQLLTNDA